MHNLAVSKSAEAAAHVSWICYVAPSPHQRTHTCVHMCARTHLKMIWCAEVAHQAAACIAGAFSEEEEEEGEELLFIRVRNTQRVQTGIAHQAHQAAASCQNP